MKTVIVIGANGAIGQAALSGLRQHRIVRANRSGQDAEHQVDISDAASLERLFERVGHFDAVVNAAGFCEYAPFLDMSEAQWRATLDSKLLGQMNVVRVGARHIADGGSFTLISGILSSKPLPMAIADATASGAIETFVKCVAFELPRGIRVNVINPTVLEESWAAYGPMMPGFQPVPGALVGKAFQRSVDGFITGQVLTVDA
ncbi:short chain dehydrogenase [Pseudoduganella violacea]|uniref:NAD(P)-dependent dehydrogenase (Short-subunit alcohol dehydrogenase family) n=1 Tax=Pseudoduganella violacea TaxID=1715466 RepID=A0A7W5BDA4_9BURK|nr:short chain dehydrogenase [Pseudoduganella violacea]MBB3121064.1 NAD(P)-dependent dehydrogenase (short-subunit alcohol dehydrogenase family) [Pseudoduganella violacea]